jgi:hypothetical protein
MSVLKEQTVVLRTAITLLVVTLAPAMLDIASMSMDMIVTVILINLTAL